MKPLAIAGSACTVPAKDSAWNALLPAAVRRRDPRVWQMSLAAALRAVEVSKCSPRSVVVGTALGALDETRNFLEGVFREGFGSPRSFIASVHNSMAGKLALELKIGGPNITVCEGHHSFASALTAARLLNHADFPVLLVVVDERIELLDKIGPHLSSACRNFLRGDSHDGAVAFMLSDTTEESFPQVRAVGPRRLTGDTPAVAVDSLISSAFAQPHVRAPFPSCSSSYLEPALFACRVVTGATPGRTAIGSYCPVSDSVAAVEIAV